MSDSTRTGAITLPLKSRTVVLTATSGTGGTTTPDSSATNNPGLLVGTVLPNSVASPWAGFGNCYNFDGVYRDVNSSGILYGNSQLYGLRGKTAATIDGRFVSDIDLTGTDLRIVEGRGLNLGTPDALDWAVVILTEIGVRSVQLQIVNSNNAVSGLARVPVAASFAGQLFVYRITLTAGIISFTVNGTTVSVGEIISASQVSHNCYSGRLGDGITPFDGRIDEKRFSDITRADGTAVPYSADANTTGLYHFDSSASVRLYTVPQDTERLAVEGAARGGNSAAGTGTSGPGGGGGGSGGEFEGFEENVQPGQIIPFFEGVSQGELTWWSSPSELFALCGAAAVAGRGGLGGMAGGTKAKIANQGGPGDNGDTGLNTLAIDLGANGGIGGKNKRGRPGRAGQGSLTSAGGGEPGGEWGGGAGGGGFGPVASGAGAAGGEPRIAVTEFYRG